MALTREDVEAILIRRVGRWLIASGLDGTTNDGTNPDLNDPIGRAARGLGVAVASIAEVDDDDLLGIADVDADKLLDLAELRTLQTCLTNYDKVNVTLGPRSESFDQLRNGMLKAIQLKREQIAADYPAEPEDRSLTGGVLVLDFQEHGDAEC